MKREHWQRVIYTIMLPPVSRMNEEKVIPLAWIYRLCIVLCILRACTEIRHTKDSTTHFHKRVQPEMEKKQKILQLIFKILKSLFEEVNERHINGSVVFMIHWKQNWEKYHIFVTRNMFPGYFQSRGCIIGGKFLQDKQHTRESMVGTRQHLHYVIKIFHTCFFNLIRFVDVGKYFLR